MNQPDQPARPEPSDEEEAALASTGAGTGARPIAVVRRLRLPALLGGRRTRWNLLAAIPAIAILFAALAVLVPPRSGPLALALVLEAQLFVAVFVVLAPIALLARARVLALALVVLVVAGGGFFGPDWVSLPGAAASRQDLSVMTWNLQYGARSAADAAAQIRGVDEDLIALEELEPDTSAAIDADPAIAARYPYRTMRPQWGARGLAVLSRYPTHDDEVVAQPARLRLVVETPRGPVRVVVGHPMPASIDTVTPLRAPIDFQTSDRDAAIEEMRQWIDPALDAGERLLVLGDFNTSPTEAEFPVLTRGLRDTQAVVGEGPGWTWRPSRLTFLPIAFLRIDLQLTAGAIYPASTSVDCSLPGDHCRLFGTYQID
jgi:endonuclease/exonuclease/phosphatase (EEP) superfamily protein YafD